MTSNGESDAESGKVEVEGSDISRGARHGCDRLALRRQAEKAALQDAAAEERPEINEAFARLVTEPDAVELRVLRFGLFQDGYVGISVFP